MIGLMSPHLERVLSNPAADFEVRGATVQGSGSVGEVYAFGDMIDHISAEILRTLFGFVDGRDRFCGRRWPLRLPEE